MLLVIIKQQFWKWLAVVTQKIVILVEFVIMLEIVIVLAVTEVYFI